MCLSKTVKRGNPLQWERGKLSQLRGDLNAATGGDEGMVAVSLCRRDDGTSRLGVRSESLCACVNLIDLAAFGGMIDKKNYSIYHSNKSTLHSLKAIPLLY